MVQFFIKEMIVFDEIKVSHDLTALLSIYCISF